MNGQKFSLSFSKKIERKSLQPSALRSEGKAEVRQTAQALLAVDQDSLKVNENVEEEELVIPLLEAKRSAVLSRLAKLQQEDGGKEAEKSEKEASQEAVEDTRPLTLEEKAERALLEESRRKLDDWTTRDVKKDITIPSAVADDPLSAPLVDIGKESSLDDYDEIGVESFGAAILRGMGWKKSEGIGGRGKRVIEIIDPASKTLGSSEGKESTGKKERAEGEEDEEELPIVKGSYVFLHSGRHRGTYGVVEVVDEDHLLIRASMTQAMIREVEGNLRAATQKEFRESSRVINKEMYDKYKEAEIKKNNEARKKTNRDEDRESSGSDRDRKTLQKTKNRDREESHRDNSRETAQRSSDSEGSKAKQESGEEERNRKPRDRDAERQREKSERLRDETDERPREKNSERERDRDNERQRDREGERQTDRDEERYRRDRDRDGERQTDRDEERYRRHREKETERQKYKESKQEYAREERKDKSRDHRDSDRKTQDSHTRHYKDSQAPGSKRKQEEFTEAYKTKQQKVVAPPWVRENLRVRIINKNYKGGKYHKEKVVVVSVVTAESCECVAESGRHLDGVDPAWLETVIPKQPPMVVMVVRGQHNGHKGRILQLHKEQEKASIQLLDDETTILKLHYDDICEYVLR